MDTRFAISQYPDTDRINQELNQLIKSPIYSIKPEVLAQYESEYYGKKCQKSKVMIDEAKTVIPGGVQHNLAFNYPFPLVFTKAEGAKLYDIDGNEYYDLLQAGGPTILGSNDPVVREAVIDLLNTCGSDGYNLRHCLLYQIRHIQRRADRDPVSGELRAFWHCPGCGFLLCFRLRFDFGFRHRGDLGPLPGGRATNKAPA